MTLRPLGFSGVEQRIQEIEAKLDQIYGRTSNAKTFSLPPNPPQTSPADPEELAELADRVADEFQIDRNLFRALIRAESGWNPRAISPKGAMGLTQLMPATAQALGVRDPFQPLENLRGGARYLKGLLERFGNLELALAAYNAGPGAVLRYNGIPPYAETQAYIRRILSEVSP